MKRVLNFLLPIICFSLLFSSCKKYPDGPGFSLLSRKARISNTWHLASYSENGVDKTSDFNSRYQNAVFVIDNTGNYTLVYIAFGLLDYTEIGTWNFANNDKDFETHPTSGNGSYGLHHILRLKNKELWYYDEDKNIKKEYHLRP